MSFVGKVWMSIAIFGSALGMTQEAPNSSSSCCQERDHHTVCTQGGDWFTRLRALDVFPLDSSGSINTIPHSGVSVHPAWTGELDIGYMFTQNLGCELILATCRNTLWGQKSLHGTKIGSTWLLPPTLTLQWRFFPSYLAQPYVGAGVNYTLFYGVHCDLKHTHLKLDQSWGPAVQAGMDIFFYDNWLFNLDFKYVWVDTTAHLRGAVHGKVHVDINPCLFGFGIGRKW